LIDDALPAGYCRIYIQLGRIQVQILARTVGYPDFIHPVYIGIHRKAGIADKGLAYSL